MRAYIPRVPLYSAQHTYAAYGIIVLAAHHSLALYENSGIVYLNSSDRVVVWFLVRSDIYFFVHIIEFINLCLTDFFK